MTYLPFSLAGILCPRINASKQSQIGTTTSADGSEATAPASASSSASKPEPFAVQARHFTELRLLNREVQIVMQTLDRTGNVLGSVLHPKGNIAVEMVKNGLAKVADRSLAALSK
jgi:staphylococcal nuclease domain-containing protein 1